MHKRQYVSGFFVVITEVSTQCIMFDRVILHVFGILLKMPGSFGYKNFGDIVRYHPDQETQMSQADAMGTRVSLTSVLLFQENRHLPQIASFPITQALADRTGFIIMDQFQNTLA